MEKERQSLPYNIRYIYSGFGHCKQPGDRAIVVSKLLNYLVKKCCFELDEAKLVLSNAVHDGILKPVLSSPGESQTVVRNSIKIGDCKLLRIPELNETLENNRKNDWYCYECHLPGTLVFCPRCPRSFHRTCKRADPEALKDITYEIANHPLTVARFHVESDLDSPVEKEKHQQLSTTTMSFSDQLSSDESRMEDSQTDLDDSDKKIDILSSALKNELNNFNTVAEVICMGQTRSPKRPRKPTTAICKNEHSLADTGEENEIDWCGPCILMKRGAWKDPPIESSEELCYLISFLFNSIQSWLPPDTFSSLPKSDFGFPKKYLDLFKRMCLKIPTSLEEIDRKIKTFRYKLLSEFLVDIQDIQHNIGIMYGSNSAEYEATTFLSYNAFYEVCEIRQCPDCYRHSNEKSTNDWFCKPCKTRHELVYAKCPTYCYWPAKVIRVKNNKYDVRFFGGNHSRAIVDASCVKPIETELTNLNLKKTTGLDRAFKELAIHQQLILDDPELYSYQSEKNNSNQNDKNVSYKENSILNESLHNAQKQRVRKSKVGSQSMFDTNSSIEVCLNTTAKRRSKRQIGSPVNNRRATSEPYIVVDKSHIFSHTNQVRPRTKANQPKNWEVVVNTLKTQMELATPENAIKIALQTFVTETNRLRGIISNLEETITINKRKTWCSMCQKQAIYYCCENYAYCTVLCQNYHWLNGHKGNCKRANATRNDKKRPILN